ncbi:ABC transporter permease [Candidatus Bandiella numerosa]|jgi:phospholipid/cholesterol/gamma-HCH transport system permease protein|uniref:MlaE family ABC transporter permease n=1 Tax=Candidatus Bandiella numerosa TaxID=2570586 RepID=UPI00249EBE39|nr:ABC transporter permease [Candidatus Bandiella numerosa]WHA05126.1 ABC transporter permease [Candidatus Bandiella numerosa]
MITLKYVQTLGIITFNFLEGIGRLVIFLFNILSKLFIAPVYVKKIFHQLVIIGFYSLPVIGLTAIFTGAVLALQTYTGFSRMHAESSIASVIVISITRELGPVLAGLMLAGRVAGSVAAEIGAMKISEQVDALYTLNTDPIKFLIIPKIIAGTIVLPILVLVSDIIGIFGGYLIAIYKIGFEYHSYINSTIKFLEYQDVISGLIKAAVFGFIVTFIGCFYGFKTSGGASGVGISATQAVVTSSILILLFNYIITGLLFVK